jgi:uncharacterized metal-binding protein
MPDAKTHDIITVVSGVVLTPLTYMALESLGFNDDQTLNYSALVLGAHMLSGIMFSPDLDLDSKIDDRWGIFYWIWRPYMWIVPHRHRILSHGLVISQLLRLFYFYVMVVIVLATSTWLLTKIGVVWPNLHDSLTEWILTIWADNPVECLIFMFGFCTGGAAHTIADWLVTHKKRLLRKFGIKLKRDYTNHDRWIPYNLRRRFR